METRTMGRSGLKLSALGIGRNNFGGRLDEAGSARVIAAALDHGVTLFDTADVYPMHAPGRSEEILGKAPGARRAEVVLATGFGMAMDAWGRLKGGSRRYLVSAVEASLKRLGTDRIDLLQFHKPDPETPIDETLSALDDLIRAGKVLCVGSSNFAAWQIVEAEYVAREIGAHRFVCVQDAYSLLNRGVEAEILPICARFGLGFLPDFPLASGLLTGKVGPGEAPRQGRRLSNSPALAGRFLTDANRARTERLSALAAGGGVALIDLAFRGLLAEPCVASVIAGASSPEQVAANAAAVAASVDAGLIAAAFLEGLAINSFKGFGTDRAKHYIPVTPDGYVIGDMICFREAEDRFVPVGQAPVANWVMWNASLGRHRVATRHDPRSSSRSDGREVGRQHYRFRIRGPNAPAILETVNGGPVPDIRFFHVGEITVAGRRVRALRHGIAGAPGLEIWGPYEQRDEVRAAIVEAGRPHGLRLVGARACSTDTLESGWIPSPLPAIWTGEALRPDREWLPDTACEALGSPGRSLASDRIEDDHVKPWELG